MLKDEDDDHDDHNEGDDVGDAHWRSNGGVWCNFPCTTGWLARPGWTCTLVCVYRIHTKKLVGYWNLLGQYDQSEGSVCHVSLWLSVLSTWRSCSTQGGATPGEAYAIMRTTLSLPHFSTPFLLWPITITITKQSICNYVHQPPFFLANHSPLIKHFGWLSFQ